MNAADHRRTGLDRVAAKVGTHAALLDDVERRRQSTRAQQDRQLIGLLNGEVAADDAAAAEDRLVDARGADHLVIEHDRRAVRRRDRA